MPSEAFDDARTFFYKDHIYKHSLPLQGNDDQAFSVLAAMAAAEYGFQRPPPPYECWQELKAQRKCV